MVSVLVSVIVSWVIVSIGSGSCLSISGSYTGPSTMSTSSNIVVCSFERASARASKSVSAGWDVGSLKLIEFLLVSLWDHVLSVSRFRFCLNREREFGGASLLL